MQGKVLTLALQGWLLAGCGGDKTTTDGESSGTSGAAESTTSTGEASTGPTGTDGTGGGTGVPAKHSEGCAPTDGAAVDFSIGVAERLCTSDFAEDAPIFRITLYQGVKLAPGVYPLDGGEGAVYYDNGMGVVSGNVGTLTIVEAVADGYVGSYDVTLSDSTKLSGAFESVYCPQDVVCG